jgi:hypothetical protein
MGLFIDHVNTVLEKLRETPITALSTDTTSEAFKAQATVRRAVKRVWNAKQWTFKYRRHTFATEASVEDYILPRQVGEVYGLKSSVAPYTMGVIREDDFDKYVPNPQASGNPQYLRLFETVGVDEQPSAASVITAVSSSASDTTQKVLIKGLVGGYTDTEELSLNGTTPVNGSKSFTEIYAVTKSAETVGRVTVTSNAGSVTNVILGTQDRTIRLRKVRLYPTPSSAVTITVKNFGLPPALTNAYEDTEIPTRWDYIIDQYAFALSLQAKGKEQLEEFVAQMNLGKTMVEEEMASEEYLSAEDIIIPEKWNGGGNGYTGWTAIPSGYGITE